MEPVTLRKFPYPFQAAVTICSDIDGTDTAEKSLAVQNFLNTLRKQGIAFYVPDRRQASIFLGDAEIPHVERNPQDRTGRESIMIARTFLTYPLSPNLESGVNPP